MAVLQSIPTENSVKRKSKPSEGGAAWDTAGQLVAKRSKFSQSKKGQAEKPVHNNAKHHKQLDRKDRKELAEHRKRKRKQNYDLEKEVTALWEKLRQKNLAKEDRNKLISETLQKMKGKLMEMGGSHVASRVLQACLKYCTQSERDAVFEELRPHALVLARNTYAYHLVVKMLDQANKAQLQQLLSLLHGQIVGLLRHPVGSAVVEHAYQLANGSQKSEMVSEFYSPEYRLFKGVTMGHCGLSKLLATETVSKQNTVLEHMMLSLQPILEKGIVDHSITHRALAEYLSVCKKTMVDDVVKSLAGPLLVRIIHTRDGAKVAVTCVKLSTAKERKSIIKGMKGHVLRIAQDEHSSIVLLAVLDVVDDTKLVSKNVLPELTKGLKDLTSHKYGRRFILHLLAPKAPRYFPPDVLAVLQTPLSLNLEGEITKSATDISSLEKHSPSSETLSPGLGHKDEAAVPEGREPNAVEKDGAGTSGDVRGISKKDASVRRLELLSIGGLGKQLLQVCTEQASQLLRSPTGTDVIYEVALGGVNGVMWEVALEGVRSVHSAIAELAARPGHADSGIASDMESEHVLEEYHASRTIRRLILNSEPPPSPKKDVPSFSSKLWATALEGKCEQWAKGHSAKVISAYTSCKDTIARGLAGAEVGKMIEKGLIRGPKSTT